MGTRALEQGLMGTHRLLAAPLSQNPRLTVYLSFCSFTRPEFLFFLISVTFSL